MNCADRFYDLNKAKHDRPSFDCGDESINRFLHTQAAKQMGNNLSITRVLPTVSPLPNGKFPICAFYTITPSSVKRADFPDEISKKLPMYPIPVFLLAQLGVHIDCQGQGLGDVTVTTALNHLWETNKQMRAYAVIVDCINERVVRFYERLGFNYLCEHRGKPRLYIRMKTVGKLFD